MSSKNAGKHKTKRFRKERKGKVVSDKKIDVLVKHSSGESKSDNRQLRNDLTKIFVLTMLAVGLEVALKLLWR